MEVYVLRFVREVDSYYQVTKESYLYYLEDPYSNELEYEEVVGGREYMLVAIPKEMAESVLQELDRNGRIGPDGWYFDGYAVAELKAVSSIYDIFPNWSKRSEEEFIRFDDDDELPF